MPPTQPPPSDDRPAWIAPAQGIAALCAVAALIFGGIWYLASQRDGGPAMAQAQATLTEVRATLRALELARERENEILRRHQETVQEMRIALERQRADLEAERRLREEAYRRAQAETDWLRRQVLDLRATGGRRGGEGDRMDGEAMPAPPEVEQREARPQPWRVPMPTPLVR